MFDKHTNCTQLQLYKRLEFLNNTNTFQKIGLTQHA